MSNFNFLWTKTLTQNNLNNVAFFFTFFKAYRYNWLSAVTPKTINKCLEGTLSLAEFFALSLTIVLCFLLRNRTETLATQASGLSELFFCFFFPNALVISIYDGL